MLQCNASWLGILGGWQASLIRHLVRLVEKPEADSLLVRVDSLLAQVLSLGARVDSLLGRVDSLDVAH